MVVGLGFALWCRETDAIPSVALTISAYWLGGIASGFEFFGNLENFLGNLANGRGEIAHHVLKDVHAWSMVSVSFSDVALTQTRPVEPRRRATYTCTQCPTNSKKSSK
jgi:hypothetical protein